VAVAAHFLPVAVAVKLPRARHRTRHVLVALRALIRVVVIGVVEVSVIVRVATVVSVGVAVGVVVVEEPAGVIRVEPREREFGRGLPEEREHLALADLARAREPDDLRQPAQHRDEGAAVIVHPEMVEAGLAQLDGAVGRGDLVEFALVEFADVEDGRAAAERELRAPAFEREHVERGVRFEAREVTPGEGEAGAGRLARVNPVALGQRSVRLGLPEHLVAHGVEAPVNADLALDALDAGGPRGAQSLDRRLVPHPERGGDAADERARERD
jgi:hypothetical protein